jgi:hypothetical protein
LKSCEPIFDSSFSEHCALFEESRILCIALRWAHSIKFLDGKSVEVTEG